MVMQVVYKMQFAINTLFVALTKVVRFYLIENIITFTKYFVGMIITILYVLVFGLIHYNYGNLNLSKDAFSCPVISYINWVMQSNYLKWFKRPNSIYFQTFKFHLALFVQYKIWLYLVFSVNCFWEIIHNTIQIFLLAKTICIFYICHYVSLIDFFLNFPKLSSYINDLDWNL